MLADPAWRARAREAWDSGFANNAFTPQSVTLRESENGAGPVGVKLEAFMAAENIAHLSDALADWVILNGTDSVALQDGWAAVPETIIKLLKDPQSIANVSDAGAHGKMFCGADGFCVVPGVLSAEELASVNRALEGAIKESRRRGVATFADFMDPNDRNVQYLAERLRQNRWWRYRRKKLWPTEERTPLGWVRPKPPLDRRRRRLRQDRLPRRRGSHWVTMRTSGGSYGRVPKARCSRAAR